MRNTNANDDAAIRVALLLATAEQVGRVYSGRPGCMCGCLGAYRAPVLRTGEDAEDVNIGQVRKVLRLMQQAALGLLKNEAEKDEKPSYGEACKDAIYAAAIIDGRQYAVYFPEGCSADSLAPVDEDAIFRAEAACRSKLLREDARKAALQAKRSAPKTAPITALLWNASPDNFEVSTF